MCSSAGRCGEWLGASLAWGGTFALSLLALTVWANLDAADWRDARPLSWQVLAMIGLSLLAGWLDWQLARTGPDVRPDRRDWQAPVVSPGPGQRAVWVEFVVSPAMRGAALAAALMLAGLMTLGFRSWGLRTGGGSPWPVRP